MQWEQATADKFKGMLDKIPVFLRPVAETKVSKKAEANASKEGRTEVNEKDMVDAFFQETPFGFHGPLKTDMESLGIDYKKYGHA